MRRWRASGAAPGSCPSNRTTSPTAGAAHAADDTPDPERLAFSRELGTLLESAIDRLADGPREVFMLRLVECIASLTPAPTAGVRREPRGLTLSG